MVDPRPSIGKRRWQTWADCEASRSSWIRSSPSRGPDDQEAAAVLAAAMLSGRTNIIGHSHSRLKPVNCGCVLHAKSDRDAWDMSEYLKK